MGTPKIGVIIGSTRPRRFADKVADWIMAIADKRSDMTFEILDLRNYPMPFLDESDPPAFAPPENDIARNWAKKLSELDGFIFLAAEYNGGPTAVLKNALDYAFKEWGRKPVAFVGYGGVGGARAVERLRLTCVQLQLVSTRASVHIGGADFFKMWKGEQAISEFAYLADSAANMLNELSWWAHTLQAARAENRN